MALRRCPGSLAFSQPKIELVRCPHCGNDAEVWSDEAVGKCSQCGKTVCRTTTQSCVDWCKYARECLGDEAHKKYQNMKTRLRKETLLSAAEAHLPQERQREQARARVAFAEEILGHEPAADPNVVLAATALIALDQAKAGGEQPSLIAGTLHDLGYPEGFIKEVCGMVKRLHDPDGGDSVNFRVVHDAELLAQGAEGAWRKESGASVESALKAFLTDTGRSLARQALAASRGSAK